MNEVNASQRNLVAAQNKAEAERKFIEERAAAEKKKMVLIGEGISEQRKAILQGMSKGLGEFKDSGLDARQAMELVVLSQQIDAWKELSHSTNAKLVFSTESFVQNKNRSNKMRDHLIQAMEQK